MASGLVITSLSRVFDRFARCRRGNVAMMFALAIIPIIGAVGAAVDYSRANAARTALQAALDSAALTLSKEAQQLSTDKDKLNARALDVVNANLHVPYLKNLAVVPTFTTPASGSFVLKLNASASVDTTIAGIWLPSMDIGTSAEAVWGVKRLELALALDNTLSMASSKKMTELKKAAKDLLKTLQNAAKKPEDVKIAIIPFNTDVNVGTGNVSANWIRWDLWENNDSNYSCSKSGQSNDTEKKCKNNGGTWQLNAKSTWNGCVADRDKNNDVNNVAPTSSATRYPANQNADCPVSMMTLSNDWTTLNTKIDSMQPVGFTNVTIGLQVAFQALSPVAPFNASSPKEDLDKVIVLLTDGDNTRNRFNDSANNIDSRTRLACTNVKAANIKLYTIRVIDGNASLLQQCATRNDMYYNVQDAAQLSAVFSTIAQNLANLRLSQ